MSEGDNNPVEENTTNKTLDNAIGLYKPQTMPMIYFSISVFLFILYLIINLIDINTFIKELNIMIPDTCTRGSIVFAYLGGYFMLFLKIILALLTLFVITSAIRVLVVIIIGVFKKSSDIEQSGGGYLAMVGASNEQTYKNIIRTIKDNTQLILGFFTVSKFIPTFFVVLPVFLCLTLILISYYYDQKKLIEEKDAQNVQNIMNTNHDLIFYFMICLILICIVYIIHQYLNGTSLKGQQAVNPTD